MLGPSIAQEVSSLQLVGLLLFLYSSEGGPVDDAWFRGRLEVDVDELFHPRATLDG